MARSTHWLSLMTLSLGLALPSTEGCVLSHDVDAMASDEGTGGMSSASNSGGIASESSSTAPSCKPADCEASPLGFRACCTKSGVCGLNANSIIPNGGCQRRDAPGSLDSSCPSSTLTIQGVPVDAAGCCRADGTCGVMDTVAGFGCTLNPDKPNGKACAGPI